MAPTAPVRPRRWYGATEMRTGPTMENALSVSTVTATEKTDETAAKRVEAVLLLEEQVAQHGCGEEPETHGREGDQAHLHRADLEDACERCLERRRNGLRVADHLAQDVELLVLPSRRLTEPEGDCGHGDDGHGQDVEGPPPPVGTPDRRGDRAHENGA